jgi:hypothetical protein
MMRRHEFIALFGGAAALPVAASGQQAERMRRLGVLLPYSVDDVSGTGTCFSANSTRTWRQNSANAKCES